MSLQETFRALNPRLARLNQDGDYRKARKLAAEVAMPDDEPAGPTVDPHQGEFLHMRANLDRELADYAEAEKYYLQALPLIGANPGKEHPSHARAMDDFGQLYMLTGRFDQAERLFRRTLEFYQARPAVDETGHARCLLHRADLLERRDFRRQALQELRQGQGILARLVGVDHPDYAGGLLIESWIICRLGQTADAEKKARRAHEICHRDLGEQHPLTGKAAHYLGRLLLSQCRLVEAEAMLSQALAIRRTTLGEEHPDYAATLEAQANLRLSQARVKEAEPLARRAVEITRTALGEKHPAFPGTLVSLGHALHSSWQLTEAEEVFQQAINLLSQCFGEHHPRVAEALLDVAVLRQNQGRTRAAEETLREGLERLDHPEADSLFEGVLLRTALADNLQRQGNLREAETLAKQAVAEGRSLAPDDPYLMCLGLVQLGQVQMTLGNLVGAQEQFRDAERVVRGLPPHHGFALDVANRAAALAHLQGDLDTVERLARASVKHAAAGLGVTHPCHSHALAYLADIVHQRGDFEQAELLYNQALDLMKRQGGQENPDRARTLRQLAQIYLARNNLPAAEVRFREALDIRKAILGDGHPDVAESLDDLGWLHLQGGNLQAAESFFHQALDIRVVTPGEEEPEYARSLHYLARVEHAMNQLPQAEKRLEQALRILRADQPDEHNDCLSVRHTLALVAWGRGEVDRAETCLKRVVARCKELWGPAPPAVVSALTDLARLYDALGDRLAALDCLKQVQAINAPVHGRQSLVGAMDLVNMSNMLSLLGEADQAEALAREALDIARELLVDNDPGLITYKIHLAAMYQAAKKNAEAETLLKHVLEELDVAVGNSHPEVARVLTQLAGLYAVTNRPAEAGPLYEQAVSVFRTAVGEDHPDHASACRALGLYYQTVADYPRAETALQKHLAITRRSCGSQHPAVVSALILLADLERLRNNWGVAETYYRDALEAVNQSDVALDAFRAALLHNLGLVRRAQGQPRQAEEMLRGALDLDRTAIGEETPGHLDALHDLASLCAATGREEEALEHWGRLLGSRQRLFSAFCCLKPGPVHELFLTQTRTAADCLLTLALRHEAKAARLALDTVLCWKNVTAANLPFPDKDALVSQHPNLKVRLEKRFYLGRQTAARGWFGVGQEGMESHRRLLSQWRKERERLEDELADQVPALASVCRHRTGMVQAIARRLSPSSTLIEMIRFVPRQFEVQNIQEAGPARYLALVLPGGAPERIAIVDLGPVAPVDQLVKAVNSWWPLGRQGKHAALANTLIAPLANHLGGRRELLFAPSGDLAQLDFASLPYRDGRPLAQSFTIRHLGCGRELVD